MSQVSWSTLLPILVIGYYNYSFPIYGLLGVARVDRLSVGGAKCHRYRSIGQQQTSAAYMAEIDE